MSNTISKPETHLRSHDKVVIQTGLSHRRGCHIDGVVTQTGHHTNGVVTQAGRYTDEIVTQTGHHTNVVVTQTGSSHKRVVTQTGCHTDVVVTQTIRHKDEECIISLHNGKTTPKDHKLMYLKYIVHF